MGPSITGVEPIVLLIIQVLSISIKYFSNLFDAISKNSLWYNNDESQDLHKVYSFINKS